MVVILNAITREFTFNSKHDGLKIHALIAVPSGNINGIVQIVHGMCEYKERYLDFMDYLAEEGFISVIHDNRGHGKSVSSQDDLGFLYKDGDIGYVKDIETVMDMVKEIYPDAPYFLLGHSMGSLGVRILAKTQNDKINGLFVLGCPCFVKFSGFALKVNGALNKKLGSHFRSEKIANAFEKLYNKPFLKENTKNAWVVSDKTVLDAYNNDSLCNYIYTLNGYESLLNLLEETYSSKNWDVKNSNLPIRFLSGKEDSIMINENKFFEAIKLFEKKGFDSVSHRIFDGMRHEILNESNKDIVYRDIAKTLYSWIDRFNNNLIEEEFSENIDNIVQEKETIEKVSL